MKKNIQYRSNKSTSPSVSDLWNKMRYSIPPLQKEHACLTYNLQAIMIFGFPITLEHQLQIGRTAIAISCCVSKTLLSPQPF
jgi:hypothetical protein